MHMFVHQWSSDHVLHSNNMFYTWKRTASNKEGTCIGGVFITSLLGGLYMVKFETLFQK